MSRPRVLVVDDEAAIRFGVRDYLNLRGYEVEEAETCAGAEERFRVACPDVVVLDYRLPDGTALDLLPRLRTTDPSVPIAILTAHGTIDLAVRAVKQGAEQFLTKPVDLAALEMVLARMLENSRNRQKQAVERIRTSRMPIDPFLGSSPAIAQLAEDARKVAAAETPVLILGETGTGKGVLARWLHANGARAEDAFVDLNCAGLSREFLETELFGHQKGAFTGAVGEKQGLLELAHHGTLFLDEIGDVDPQVQPKLLKVLEEKHFRRLGGVHDRTIDVRWISATGQDLHELMLQNRFRRDLYFRLSTIPLHVPPLRDRREDIPALAREILARIGAESGRGAATLDAEAEKALISHAWPGNIRELRNVLERAVLLGDGRVLGAAALRFEAPVELRAGKEPDDSRLTLAGLERLHIERALREEGGSVAAAATRLGISRSSLYQKLKATGIAFAKS